MTGISLDVVGQNIVVYASTGITLLFSRFNQFVESGLTTIFLFFSAFLSQGSCFLVVLSSRLGGSLGGSLKCALCICICKNLEVIRFVLILE